MPEHPAQPVDAGPASGLRVVTVARTLPLDMGSMILADLGADVVMVEDPDRPLIRDDALPAAGGLGHGRVAFNRNKRAVALRLDDESQRSELRRLLDWADIVILDSSEPDAAPVRTLVDDLAASRPELITCDCAPWGTFGSRAGERANDLALQAAAGCMELTGEPEDPPTRAGIPVMDLTTGTYVAIAVLAAAVSRQTNGRGARLSVAGYDTAVALLSNMASAYFATGEYKSRLGTGHISIFPYNAFRTADGEVVLAIFTQAFWSKFCIGVGREDLLANPRYKTIPDRMKAKDELSVILDKLFLEHTTAEWSVILERADVPYGPVLGVGPALALEQTRARGMTPELIGTAGVQTVGSPMSFRYADGTSYRPAARPAPARGQDSVESIVASGRPRAERSAQRPPAETGLPLAGVRVVDLTRMFAGPWAGEILGDLGATVIKVEEPRIGDPTRRHRPLVGDESSYFIAVNRGKRSLAIDARSDEGRGALSKLIQHSDVVIENFRPGVTDRLGIGNDAMAELNPGLVYCSLSGFGATGPMRDRISFDIVNQAFSGLIDVTGHPHSRASRIGVPIGDLSGGLYMAISVLAGLHHRNVTGRGCWVDLGLHDTLISLLADLGQSHFFSGDSPTRVGNLHHSLAPHGCYRTADGWLVVTAADPDDWDALCDVLELPAAVRDGFRDPAVRAGKQAELQRLLHERFGSNSTAHWVGRLREHGLVCEPIVNVQQTLESSELAGRGLIYEAPGGDRDTFRMLASPMIVNADRLGVGSVAPRLGQHTAAVLTELGYSAADVDAMVEAGTAKVDG